MKYSKLNKKMTFDNYEVNKGNEFAVNISNLTIKHFGQYNPIFIYGKKGLGKTHLINAIGNKIKKDYKDKIVKYLTTEELLDKGKKCLKKCDALLIDNIDFVFGKQVEGIKLFNLLKPISQRLGLLVFASDSAVANNKSDSYDVSYLLTQLQSTGSEMVANITKD